MPASSAASSRNCNDARSSPESRRRPTAAPTELALTAKGRAAFAELDRRSRGDVAAMLDDVDAGERAGLVDAMATIERLRWSRRR